MRKSNIVLAGSLKKLRLLPLAAMFLIPMSGFTQNNKGNTTESDRAELKYKQRHSRLNANNLYADGIKIKRDLSILKEIQEERILSEDEIPAEDLYGGIWNNRYVNAYRSIENIPDTFKVNLANFTIPTTGYITSNFGPRRRRMHYGIDLKVQTGDTIYAAFDGKVRVKQYERRGYGYYLTLRHPNGLETVYGHLSRFLVEEDDVVKSGDPIALGGNTGRSTGSHLHFEIRFLGNPINPTYIVDFDNKVCHKDTYMVTANSYNRSSKGVNVNNLASTPTRSKVSTTNKYASGKVNYYRIKKGDTLGAIARKYGTSVSKLCSLNSMTAKTVLRPGKAIRTS
ncbi:peptidoglycan DD-metalloendopeptidase family protein [Dysgonomonas sp. BGC7]|uniref:peptidoglycan DD-metalloendopeptidase family protein n=1 Tax=Dysgonomonas sp. BGC7 TaxID=1658008 RepID=UPI0006826DBB|nr:peptidoglycan DD-metalloendopeptidase family protein [Dysgonomonas sp. BGC7]MBD8389564.1 peptidoglycan DD-metalloendopeptidase family protein [Dysgonomonas sp. BGC7]